MSPPKLLSLHCRDSQESRQGGHNLPAKHSAVPKGWRRGGMGTPGTARVLWAHGGSHRDAEWGHPAPDREHSLLWHWLCVQKPQIYRVLS